MATPVKPTRKNSVTKVPEKVPEKLTVNLEPLHEMHYNQIPNHNFCYALLDPNNAILHTPCTCKDYLQDIIFVEHSGKPGSVFGLTWKPGRIDLNLSRYRMALFGGGVKLQLKVATIQELINYFDDAQGIDRSLVLETTDPEIIVVDYSKEWLRSCPQFSALTTIIRISGPYTGGDPIEFLMSMEEKRKKEDGNPVVPSYSQIEVSRLSRNLPRLLALLAGKTFSFSWNSLRNTSDSHETGIFGYDKFPEVDIPNME